MEEKKAFWKEKITYLLNKIQKDGGEEIIAEDVLIETPPKEELGDIAVPLFLCAKKLKKAPTVIAKELLEEIEKDDDLKKEGSLKLAGPYINIFLNRELVTKNVLSKILKAGSSYGSSKMLECKRIMIEFSGPNTNKPLHLGHLRNDVIGESLARLLSFCSASVYRVNIINDRGVHICKSMFAYQKLASNKTPESEGVKSDHFVGNLYVAFHNYQKDHPEVEDEVKAMLKEWEEKEDSPLRTLWKKMNMWALQGIEETYKRTDISFDKLYFESETYLKGKDEVLKGLKNGVFYKKDDGSIAIDLRPINIENEKILLRNDGTSLYITQDIGTAISRQKDWSFDRMIYVVANEQEHYFKVLFYVLKSLGYKWAKEFYHLAYGMVNLPEGKMKSREGTVVDADNLLDALHQEAKNEILEKGHMQELEDIEETSEHIALAALHYFLLQVSPKKDMLFDPKKSLSFNGNTGPYLQYMGSRISSLLEKACRMGLDMEVKEKYFSLLKDDSEWALIKVLSQFPKKVETATEAMDSSIVANYLYELSKSFSRFYHDCVVITDDEELTKARLLLCKAARITLQNGMKLCVLPFIEVM